jgi:hypothetical protein
MARRRFQNEEQPEPGHAGEHQNPADHMQIETGHRGVPGERQDRAEGDQKNAYSDTHDDVIPRRRSL